MKKILCFGDSNTWGYVPGGKHIRYSRRTRYPMVLQKLLGKNYKVYEEGQCARTICNDDPTRIVNVNGEKVFLSTLQSYLPLDYVVIYLGSNDMKDFFDFTSKDAAKAIEDKYIAKIREIDKNIKIIIICPKEIKSSTFYGFDNAYIKSKDFLKDYEDMAKRNNCLFVSNEGIKTGSDGLHLTQLDHQLIATRLFELIK